MLEGSRTIWWVSFHTSARTRRNFDRQAFDVDAGAIGIMAFAASCGRLLAAGLLDYRNERLFHGGFGRARRPGALAHGCR
jgi:hypothetical protein